MFSPDRWVEMMIKHVATLLISLVMVLSFSAGAIALDYTVSPMVGAYLFENNLQWKNGAVYSLGLGANLDEHWSIEGSGDYVETERSGSSAKYDFYSGRIGGLYHFTPLGNVTPYLMAGIGALRVDHNDDGQITYGAGTKLGVADNLALRFEGRHVIGIDMDKDDVHGTYNHFVFTAGLAYTFGGTASPPAERLGHEEAPQGGEPVAAEQQHEPLPEPEKVAPEAVTTLADQDEDGVTDIIDRCPSTPKGIPVDEEGCPQSVKFVDTDGDGVSDALDACPNTPESSVVDLRGCSEISISDTDGDGVFDDLDKCPGTEHGIPVDSAGCPELSVELKIGGLVIEFATASAGISEEADRELELLAAKVNSTERGRLIVEGHTDNVGRDSDNFTLSQKRAESIRLKLINDYGVDAGRVIAKGYGPSKPVADNDTQEGRQQNRRVVVRYEP